jgi:hypothetical protein
MSKKQIVLWCAGAFVAGYLLANASALTPINPFVPHRPDRPVLRMLARLAKLGLWAAMFAEPQPQSDWHDVSFAVNSDALTHREGW